MKRGRAPTDSSQGPTDSLFDEIPFVGGGALDEREGGEKGLVAAGLVVQGETGEKGKGRAFHKLGALVTPLPDLCEGVWCPIEKMETEGVANGPVVEVAAPAVHLSGRDAR